MLWPLQVVLADESGLTSFLQLVSSGQNTSAVSLVGAGSGGGALTETYRVNLADVLVTNVSENTGHGYVVTLQYGEIGVVVQTVKPSGVVGTPLTFGYDIAEAHSEAPPLGEMSGSVPIPGLLVGMLKVKTCSGPRLPSGFWDRVISRTRSKPRLAT